MIFYGDPIVVRATRSPVYAELYSAALPLMDAGSFDWELFRWIW